VSPVKYELGFYIPEDDILHSHCREDLKCYAVRLVSSSKVLTDICVNLSKQEVLRTRATQGSRHSQVTRQRFS
jgi:hypothetical protein